MEKRSSDPALAGDHASLLETVTMTFAEDVDWAWKMARETGVWSKFTLDESHQFIFDLIGGTGDLFSFSSYLPGHVPGDVDGDGFSDGDDLATIISNWGLSGATREQGDLNVDGIVSGPDYAEVLSFWAPEPTEPTPEPATLTIISAAGCCVLLANGRKKRKK